LNTTIADDFEVLSSKSNYFKMVPGEHRIRVLSNSISGWLWWVEEGDGTRKPQRITLDQNPPVEFADSVKKFLTFVVWNYDVERIQVWEVTQASIQKELKRLDHDTDWGALTGYDLKITRVGTDMNSTRYAVTPKPKSELGKEIEKATKDGLPVLEALYKGEDPFKFNPNAVEEVDQEKVDKDLSF